MEFSKEELQLLREVIPNLHLQLLKSHKDGDAYVHAKLRISEWKKIQLFGRIAKKIQNESEVNKSKLNPYMFVDSKLI